MAAGTDNRATGECRPASSAGAAAAGPGCGGAWTFTSTPTELEQCMMQAVDGVLAGAGWRWQQECAPEPAFIIGHPASAHNGRAAEHVSPKIANTMIARFNIRLSAS